MREGTGTEPRLMRLSDSSLALENSTQDVGGVQIYDKDGERIGTVEGLYADEVERKVHFLDVDSRGSPELGEKRFLIPVEAVRRTEEKLVVDHSREKVVDSPPFSTDIEITPSYQRVIYRYYGLRRPVPHTYFAG